MTHVAMQSVKRHASRVLAAVGLTLATLSVAQAQLSVRPDATTLHESDTFEIIVEAVGVDVGSPDFSPLERDFIVLGTRSSSQYQSINGRVEAWTRWILTAKPRRAGRLTVPSLQLGQHRSAAVDITVKPLDPATRAIIESTVFFEVEATPQPVYVQAQLVVTRRLFYADGAQLYGDIPATPELNDAVVQAIGSSAQSIVIRDGRRYGVVEHQFAVFPEGSGRLTIPSVAVSGSIRLPAEFGARRRTAIRVQSEPLEIQVLPIPADYPKNVPWLPASHVELLEDWNVNGPLQIGTPVQRALTVRATGAVASMIPPLVTDLPDTVRGYPDPPALTDAPGQNTLIGSRLEATSLVPGQPGTVNLPPVEVTWFDTDANAVRTTRVAARQVNVRGSAAAASPVSGVQPTASPNVEPSTADAITQPPPAPATPQSPTLAHLFAALLAIALVGWAATGWRLRQTRRTEEAAPEPAVAAVAEAVCFKQLNKALASGGARRVKQSVADWGAAYFECRSPDAIARLRRADSDLAASLDQINGLLYANHTETDTDAADISVDPSTLAALKDSLARIRTERKHQGPAADALPPLYPT